MFGIKKPTGAQAKIDTLIGPNTRIEGNLRFSGGMRIEGQVVGDVIAESPATATLVLAENGKVEGAVTCGHLIVNGKIDGPVVSSEFLELLADARLNGDVTYKVLEMHMGAVIDGRLKHISTESARAESAESSNH